MSDSHESDSSNFTLRTVSPVGEIYGALVFIADSAGSVQAFLRELENVMFPPGGRSSSFLSVQDRESGALIYSVSSSAGSATIHVTQVPQSVTVLVRVTLRQCGSIPMIFGFSDDSEVTLIDPVKNYIIKTEAYVDDKHIGPGRSSSYDWSSFLRTVAEENSIVPAERD